MSFDRGTDKKRCGTWSMYKGTLLNHKKWNNGIYSHMNGPRDYHTKWSKSEREKQIPYDIHLCVQPKIWHKGTYPQNKNRLTDTENRPVFAKGQRGREGRTGSVRLADVNCYI